MTIFTMLLYVPFFSEPILARELKFCGILHTTLQQILCENFKIINYANFSNRYLSFYQYILKQIKKYLASSRNSVVENLSHIVLDSQSCYLSYTNTAVNFVEKSQ